MGESHNFSVAKGASAGAAYPYIVGPQYFGVAATDNFITGLVEGDVPGDVVDFGPEPGDFNNDNFVDNLDIDLMRNAILAGAADATFNVDGIGGDVPAAGDYDFLVEDIIGTGRGDGDLNKVINFADFALLSNNFGQTNTNWDQGNYNIDTVTNFADFAELSNRFGMAFPSDQPVPEATSLCLMAGVLLLMRKRRRQA